MNNKLALIVQFSSIDKLSGSLRNIVGLGRTGTQALRGLQGEANRLKRDMAEAGRAIENGSGNVTQLINRERALAAQLASTNRQLQQQKNMLAIDGRVAAMENRGQNLMARGQNNMLTGAAMLGPIALMVRSATEFDSGMTDIQIKANLTARDTAIARRNILAAAQAARQLPESMRAGVDTLVGFGLDPRLATRMISPIGRAATATRAEVNDIAATAYSNMSNLHVPINQTARALDAMAAAGNAGAFEMRDMAQYFPALTAQAQALGQSGVEGVSDLAAAAQIARTATADGATAATNLQNLLVKINAKPTVAAFARMGVDLPASLRRLYAEGKTPLEAIAELTNKTLGGDLSRMSYLFEDQQAQAALRPLIQRLAEYRQIRAQAMQASGTIDRAFATRASNNATQMQALQGNLQRLGITLGTLLLPSINAFVAKAAIVADRVATWADAHPKLAGGIMQAVMAFGLLRVGMGAMQFLFGGLLGPVAKLWGLFAKARSISLFSRILGSFVNMGIRAAPLLMRAFGIIRIAVMFLARGVMQAGMMLLANPVVLAITAIILVLAAAGYLIYTHWDTIKAAFWTGVGYLTQAWTWIKSIIMRFPLAFGPLGLVARWVLTHWEGIKAAFWTGINFIRALVPSFLSVGREIINGLIAGITGNPAGVWNALRNIVMMGVNRVKSFLGIASPSRLFMAIGGHMTDGLAVGLDRGGRRPLASLSRLATGLGAGLTLGTAFPATAGAAANGAANGAASSSPNSAGGGSVTINVYARDGEGAQAIAERVAALIERKAARKGRSSYADQ